MWQGKFWTVPAPSGSGSQFSVQTIPGTALWRRLWHRLQVLEFGKNFHGFGADPDREGICAPCSRFIYLKRFKTLREPLTPPLRLVVHA